jgi:hypothetical protein
LKEDSVLKRMFNNVDFDEMSITQKNKMLENFCSGKGDEEGYFEGHDVRLEDMESKYSAAGSNRMTSQNNMKSADPSMSILKILGDVPDYAQ